MKKSFIFMLALYMLFSLCACAAEQSPVTEHTEETNTPASETTAVPETTVATEATAEKTVINMHVDRRWYESEAELAEHAELIVYGTVLSQHFEMRPLGWYYSEDSAEILYCEPDPVTVVTLQIHDIYKGSTSSDVIDFTILGGESEDTIYQIEDSAVFETGSSYIVYLRYSRIYENAGVLIGNTQGQYEVHGGSIRKCLGGFDLTFTGLEATKAELSTMGSNTEKPVIEMHGSRPWYESVSKLTDQADWIIYGTVLDQHFDNSCPLNDPNKIKIPRTVITMQVHEVYKGTVISNVIDFTILGGETEDTVYQIKNSAVFENGASYVVYLRQFPTYESTGFLIGNTQGQYEVDGSNIQKGTDGFDLTFAELQAMKAELSAVGPNDDVTE